MTPRDTAQALAQITDEGLFEQLATAVLRVAEPLCAGLTHPGVNAAGKTRKAPLDNVCFVLAADPPHMVAVHHTTTLAASLAAKWLHDPATVIPRKRGGTPTAPAGDLIKTAQLIDAERLRSPTLVATLFLTTNEEPDVPLVLEIQAAGAARGVAIDIWSRSRLAHVLDFHPTGQMIRRKYLGMPEDLLSDELLAELSGQNLAVHHPPDDPRAWTPRALDEALADLQQPCAFLIAGSGLGKTVAVHRALRDHVEQGGVALVLSHDHIAASATLDQAIVAALVQLHPTLVLGQSALALCTPERSLLLAIEDINRSGQALRLTEKLIAWIGTGAGPRSWRLICPLWPQVLSGLSDQTRKAIQPLLLYPEPLSQSEGAHAVRARAALAGRTLSEVQAGAISAALGHDPLLIALHDIDQDPAPEAVLAVYVEGSLQRTQLVTDETAGDLRAALAALARAMLARRVIDPSWAEISTWGLEPAIFARLRCLTQHHEILRLEGPSTHQRLMFRHDRVRDWLLVEAAAGLAAGESLSDDLLGEPFFAEVMAAVLVRHLAPRDLLARTARLNPLALFHALRLSPVGAARDRICKAIEAWLEVPDHRTSAFAHVRWHGLAALEQSDGPEVVSLVKRFPDDATHGLLARLRNGDLEAGGQLCHRYELGVHADFRDHQIAHAKAKYGPVLIAQLREALVTPYSSADHRAGWLALAGYIGDPTLAAALKACWDNDPDRQSGLEDYLWAFARCCTPQNAAPLLDPVCAAWGALSDEAEEPHHGSPRSNLAAHGARAAFSANTPTGALDYLVARAGFADLNWPLTYVLQAIDHPIAMKFVVDHIAGQCRNSKDGWSHHTSSISQGWEWAEKQGRPMSAASRDSLQAMWTDPAGDPFVRKTAFDLWSGVRRRGDMALLRTATPDPTLGERALRMRLRRGDHDAIPLLLERLTLGEEGAWWWHYGRHVWSPQMSQALDRQLSWCAERAGEPGAAEKNAIVLPAEMIVRLPRAEAEHLLLKYWDRLGPTPAFFQAALYVATPSLLARAAEVVAKAVQPSKLFAHLAMHHGVRVGEHPGVTREDQILALEPYLDLISQSDLGRFSDACNQGGWYDTRRRLLDPRVNDRRSAWRAETAHVAFDQMVSDRSHCWIDHEVDDALASGVSWSQFIDQMESWQGRAQSWEGLKLLVSALNYRGARDDLRRLKIYPGMEAQEAQNLITDTRFAVLRRTLR